MWCIWMRGSTSSVGVSSAGRRQGTNRKVIYTYPSKKSLNSIVGKVRYITRRSGSPYMSLEHLLKHLGPVVRGWCMYFRHGVPAATYRYLYFYSWKKVARWLMMRHPRLGWRKIKRRYLQHLLWVAVRRVRAPHSAVVCLGVMLNFQLGGAADKRDCDAVVGDLHPGRLQTQRIALQALGHQIHDAVHKVSGQAETE